MINNPLKATLITLLFPVIAWSNATQASLIGDAVDCSFAGSSLGFGVSGPCSTSSQSLVPGPALVNENGVSDPEFYIAASIISVFDVVGSVDISANSITLLPLQMLAGIPISLQVDFVSLDWLGMPDGVITDVLVNVSNIESSSQPGTTGVAVTHGEHSLSVMLEDVLMTPGARVEVELITSHAQVPAASPLLLLLLGLAVLAAWGRITAPQRALLAPVV